MTDSAMNFESIFPRRKCRSTDSFRVINDENGRVILARQINHIRATHFTHGNHFSGPDYETLRIHICIIHMQMHLTRRHIEMSPVRRTGINLRGHTDLQTVAPRWSFCIDVLDTAAKRTNHRIAIERRNSFSSISLTFRKCLRAVSNSYASHDRALAFRDK